MEIYCYYDVGRHWELPVMARSTDLSVVPHKHFPPDDFHHCQTVHLGHGTESLHYSHPLPQLHQKSEQSLEFLAVLVCMEHHVAAPSISM